MTGPTLTPRESAILAAVERRLSNPEIAAELFISVRTVETHIAALRRKLGADSRGALIAAAGERRGASVRLPKNAFVGREADLASLSDSLADQGWVTVIGPGGVGKTRLALEFAESDARIPVIVELEHAEPGDVVARVARSIDLEAAPGTDPASAVGVALASHPYLLVLDNADRVGQAVGDAVGRFRAVAPSLRVLATSRTPIGDPSETVHTLAPLAVDGPDAAAVAMFQDRLAAAGIPSTAGDAEREERICARLDGLPLAIELAAASARHLSIDELSERLERDFATLDRAAPPGRHRSLETAFEWTWDLLSDDERDVLRRLAALPRTFDVDLAAAVTHPGAEGVVMRLLDHAMIVPAGGRPRRFRLLAVMREFIRARTDPALIRTVLEQHAAYIARVAAAFAVHARTDNSAEAMHLSAQLCPELNAALRWALAARHPSALSMASTLAIGVEQYGSDLDSVRTLAMAAEDDLVLTTANPSQLLLLGNALAFLDVQLVGSLADRALETASSETDEQAAEHLAGLADAYRDLGPSALDHLARAERLAAQAGDEWELAAIRQMRGIAERGGSIDDPAAAIATFESAMLGYARAGDLTHANNARYMMALTAAESGMDEPRAAGWAAACVDYAAANDNEHELAHAHLAQAMLGSAPVDVAALTETFRGLGDLRCVTRCLVLRADRSEGVSRLGLLEQALGVAESAGDVPRQDAIRSRLAEAMVAGA